MAYGLVARPNAILERIQNPSLRQPARGRAFRPRDVLHRTRNLSVSYAFFKFLHLLGTVLLVGNVTATSVWKVFADRTRQASTVAFAQRLVTYTDWALTGGGIVLMMVGGYGMVLESGMSLIALPWLLWGQVLFVVSGLVWLFILVPIQSAQSRMAVAFADGSTIPAAYWSLSRRWIAWGVVATAPLVAALYLMVMKA
jgi:uncharacterized membrane protein